MLTSLTLFGSHRQSKEYSHVVASSTHAIEMEMKRGKILTELTVPENAIATMSTTKIISIEYKLQILFDMRPRTGFLEGKNRRSVNKKLRAKITGKPGGFEVEVPVVIGTLLDSSYAPGSGTSSLAISLPGIQPSEIPSPGSSVRTLEHLVSNMHMSSSSEGMQEALHPKMQHQASHSGFHTIPIAHGRQASEPAFGLATVRGPSSQPVRHHTAHYIQQTAPPSAPSEPLATSDPYQELKALPPLPPSATPYHPPSPSMTSSSSSSSSSAHTPSSSSYQPPRLPYRANSESSSSSSPISLTTPNGYPNEKRTSMRHQLIQSPNSYIVESPTAPQAVSLGLGPASPGAFHRSVSTVPGTSSSSSDYFQVVPIKQHSLPLGYGAFASTAVSTSPNQAISQQGYIPRTTYTQPHASRSTGQTGNYSWSTSSPSSSSGGSSSVARSPQLVPPPLPLAPAVPRNPQSAMDGGRGVLVTRPESFHPAPPYTPMA